MGRHWFGDRRGTKAWRTLAPDLKVTAAGFVMGESNRKSYRVVGRPVGTTGSLKRRIPRLETACRYPHLRTRGGTVVSRVAGEVFRLKACEIVAGGKSATGPGAPGPPPDVDAQDRAHPEKVTILRFGCLTLSGNAVN